MGRLEGNDASMGSEYKRLRKIGGSINISLPPQFVKAHGLKAGQDVVVVFSTKQPVLRLVLPTEVGDIETDKGNPQTKGY